MSCNVCIFEAMAKKNTITIDFDVWCTQTDKAAENPIKLNTLSQQVKRVLEGQKSPLRPDDVWHIPQLGITLVKR